MQALFLTQSALRLPHADVMSKKPDTEFGNRLERLIQESNLAGMNGKELSKVFGVSEPMISFYKSGEKLPSMDRARHISTKLGCCVEYLLTGRGPVRPPCDVDNGDIIRFDMRGIPRSERARFETALRAVAQSVQEVMSHYST